MNKYEKETEKVLLDHEKKAYNDLKATYTNALKDIKLRIRDLQADIDLLKMTEGDEDAKNRVQSKVYQLEYQKALEGQINAILEVVKQDNVKTTQTFLTKMYEDSYLAINYNLQKRGIPVIMPINNKLIVDVINMPTEDLKFSERLYTQVNHLKKTVKAEISRGIATGQSYGKIAQQVSLLTEADLNKSYRIVRTEGGRVSSEAKLQSMQEAKARGCDIVKQWDATLDNATRDVHQQLDGQWVEVDEYFKASGYKTKRPHGFGMASQDINCRCVLLSVPRWDLEDTVEKLDNITGEIITAKNYADWKQKYYSVVSDYKELVKEETTIIKQYEKNIDKIVSALNEIENSRRKLNYEVGTIIDLKGNVLEVTEGGDHEVTPSNIELLKNNIFTHNHPTGGCFSTNDIKAFIETGPFEVRASTPQGTYYSLKRTDKAINNDLIKDYEEATNSSKAYALFNDKIRSGVISGDEMKSKGFKLVVECMAELGHAFLKENALKYGVVYTEGVIK